MLGVKNKFLSPVIRQMTVSTFANSIKKILIKSWEQHTLKALQFKGISKPAVVTS